MRVIIPVAGDYIHAARVLIHSLATKGMRSPAAGSQIVLAQIGDVCDECRSLIFPTAGEWSIDWFDATAAVAALPAFVCASERYKRLYAKLGAYAVPESDEPTWMMDADLFCLRDLRPLLDVRAWAGTASRTGEHEEFGLPNDPRTCISAGMLIVETGQAIFDKLTATAAACLDMYGDERKRQGDEWILAEAFGSGVLPQPTILSARYNWFSLGTMFNGPDSQVDRHVSIAHFHNGRWMTAINRPTATRGTWGAAYHTAAEEAGVLPMREERRRCRC